MINYTTLKTNIAEIIVALTSLQVIWQEQNASTPSGDFIMLKIESLQKIGYTDSVLPPNDSGISETQGDREFILNVQCISKDAMQILSEFENKLNLKTSLELLDEAKLAYINQDGDISDITTKIGDRFENRASIDLRFRISKNYSSNTTENVGIIENVNMSQSINNDDVSSFESNYTIEV